MKKVLSLKYDGECSCRYIAGAILDGYANVRVGADNNGSGDESVAAGGLAIEGVMNAPSRSFAQFWVLLQT